MTTQPDETADPLAWAKEAGQFQFLYRCDRDGARAYSSAVLPHCLWHGEDCDYWYVMVPADQAAAHFADMERV